MSESRGLVAHQFDTIEQQRESSYEGMWIFLATEVMFLGGLFAAYSVYRYSYAGPFREASTCTPRSAPSTLRCCCAAA